MTQRITTQLLVTIRHEKPIDKIAEVIACRLSMLEGVDGSGVDAVVVVPEPVKEDDVLQDSVIDGTRLAPEEKPAIQFDVSSSYAALAEELAQTDFDRDGRPLETSESEKQALLEALEKVNRQTGIVHPVLHLLGQRITPLPGAAVVPESTPAIEPLNKDGLSREQFDNYAAMLTKGMGENITP